MKLKDISEILVGQIMTRVTDESGDDGRKVTALTPKAINDGHIEKEYLKEILVTKLLDADKYTKKGDVIIKLSTPYDAAYIDEENEGYVIPSFLAAIRITDTTKIDGKYLTALINTKYIHSQMESMQAGAYRAMIRVSDIREIEIPNISIETMRHIGQEYELSCQKRQVLWEMLNLERKIMENVVLQSIKESEK